jgi:hypothetical protein
MNSTESIVRVAATSAALLVLAFAGFSHGSKTAAAAGACSEAVQLEVLAPAAPYAAEVELNCSLTLPAGRQVTKRIVLSGSAASGTTLDCQGSTLDGGSGTVNADKDMIEVRSRDYAGADNETRWERPENVTIKNCLVVGSVRINGMGDVREASRRPGYVALIRQSSPKRVTFDRVTITGVNRSIFYVGAGVTDSSLINSEIKGTTEGAPLYLDAESSRITIKDNYIHARTAGREQLSIDSSNYSRILNNRFSALHNGGIYLYRNCGERGVIRHTTPSHNTIVNNVFYYDEYTGLKPAVYIASRNGNDAGHGFCDHDSGYDFGSSVSDLDHATHNVVMQNQVYKRSLAISFQMRNPGVNRPNFVEHNESVDEATKRRAGCYVADGFLTNFITDGQTIEVFRDAAGEPVTKGFSYVCRDGAYGSASRMTWTVTKKTADCQISGSNVACEKIADCDCEEILAAVAACNLEHGSVSLKSLQGIDVNVIKVLRSSDVNSEGSCHIGGVSLRTGQKTISGIQGKDRVAFGCSERDKNGGDCHIRITLYGRTTE